MDNLLSQFKTEPAGIYLHIPFCVRRCSYCDFFSTIDLSQINNFAEALIREIQIFGELKGAKLKADTIYFGGGTPSLLPADNLRAIMRQLHKSFEISCDAEVTLEANPGAIDMAFAAYYREIGINRISLGMQSFDDSELKFLSRIHSSSEAIESYKYLISEGFENISIDLIFGLPGQSLANWEKNLSTAFSLNPSHISAYNLIYEKGTDLEKKLTSGKIKLLDEILDREIFLETSQYLTSHGYEHYEISNFARPGLKSRHNTKYWKHIDYYGFGPSAHSLDGNKRYWNTKDMHKYYSAVKKSILPVENHEIINEKELLAEIIMLSLRSEGLEIDLINKLYGIEISGIASEIKEKYKRYLFFEGNKIRLNSRGYYIIDEISTNLLHLTEKII